MKKPPENKPLAILPTEYHPKEVSDFFGPARAIAQRIMNSKNMCVPRKAAAAHLFLGDSGIGKTALATFTLEQYGVSQWNLCEIFGADLTVDRVREVSAQMKLSNMFGGYRGYFFDEIDRCTNEARNRLLEIVGDQRQPKETIIVATSNLSSEEFDALEKTPGARGCLTSRFQVHSVKGPMATEIEPLLGIWLPPDDARNLALLSGTGANGKPDQPINVRGALRDAITMMQLQPA
jgi:replication-associated recombination protein RarA